MRPDPGTSSPTYSSPRNFVKTVRKLMADAGTEQRRDARIPKRISLKIQPLDNDFHPDGESFWAISSDISKKGIGFISSDPLAHEFLRITLVDEDDSVVAKLRHSTSIGTGYPLYLIGVEFLDEYLV